MTILLLLALVQAGPDTQWPCDPPPRPIVSIGTDATITARMDVVNRFYMRCFGTTTGHDAPLYYLASADGRVRRQGAAQVGSGEVLLGLYVAYHARGYAAFTLTYSRPRPNGDFCSFALPAWSQADLDRRAEECVRAMATRRGSGS